MGFERNSQGRILSNLINKSVRFYTSDANLNINPWFICGFTDGEGCFSVSIIENKEFKTGKRVLPSFQITLHKKDKPLLEQIQSYPLFGVGKIYKQGSELIQFRVQSLKDLKVVIDYFDKFPLITEKWADYFLFKQILNLMLEKEHRTLEGLYRIIAIKASINRGLTDKLKFTFSSVTRVVRPSVINIKIPDPNWLAGFTSAEGSFMVQVKTSGQVQLVFRLGQHSRDEQLMESLIYYLHCGSLYKQKEAVIFEVKKLSDINEKIIPFFKKYPILGVKSKNFESPPPPPARNTPFPLSSVDGKGKRQRGEGRGPAGPHRGPPAGVGVKLQILWNTRNIWLLKD